MSDDYALTTDDVRKFYQDWQGPTGNTESFDTIDSWLMEHDAATKTANIEEAAVIADYIYRNANPATFSACRSAAIALRTVKVGEE